MATAVAMAMGAGLAVAMAIGAGVAVAVAMGAGVAMTGVAKAVGMQEDDEDPVSGLTVAMLGLTGETTPGRRETALLRLVESHWNLIGTGEFTGARGDCAVGFNSRCKSEHSPGK